MSNTADLIVQLKTDRIAKLAKMRALNDAAELENRALSRRETAEYATLERDVEQLAESIRKTGGHFDPRRTQGTPFESDDAEPASVLRPGDKMVDHLREHQPQAFRGTGNLYDELFDPARCSLGRAARGLITGNWQDADLERRAMLEGGTTTGGALLPIPLAGHLVDLVRNKMRLMQVGASVVPLTAPVTYMGRLTAGPNPALAWKTEGAGITASDLAVDRITFTAQMLPCLVKVSFELFDDLTPQAADLIQNEIVQALALELDRTCLRGSGAAPEPQGVRNQAGVTITSLGANGAAPIWDNIVDGVYQVRNANLNPSGILYASRTEQTLSKFKTAIGSYLEPPTSIDGIPRLSTNQIPTNLVQGNSSVASEIYIADWQYLMLGMRQEIGFGVAGDSGQMMGSRVRVLTERFADQGLLGLICYARADVQLAHSAAFTVLTGVTT